MIELITDRTESDVLLGTEKGFYGVADLNRVEKAVSKLLEVLPELDVVLSMTVKTDWELSDTFSQVQWPTVRQMQRYLGNVQILLRSIGLDLPLPHSMERLTWEGANQIEAALLAAQKFVDAVKHGFYYSGEFYSGEETSL